MTTIQVLPAEKVHFPDMVEILNALIEEGNSTALMTKVSGEDLWQKARAGGPKSAWHVAVDENGTVQGFQWIAPYPGLPPEAVDIATFTRIGKTGMGIGSKLFEASKAKATEFGYEWINANIRADNISGLAYYASRGFYDYDDIKDYRMDDGRVVDKVLKRFDLK